ncbi:MAG: FecR domain-containing protein, partial [Flavobacteriales bacterium]
FVADNSYVTVTLPDSSVVTLSPGTRLVATVEAERRVQLNGQAYFEVEHDEQRPFVVEAGDQEVTVLGTAFEVTQRAGNDSLVVRVRNGRVGVSQPNATHMTVLVGGERGVWVGSNERERTETSPVERWAGRIIQFSNAPLQQVVEELNTLYDVHIELGSEAITACPLTASFGDEPIDEIIRVIAGTFGLEVARSPDGAFTLTGDGC